MYFGRKYYDQAALVSIMIFNERTLAMNAICQMKEGVHFAHLQVEFKVVWPFQAASVISLYSMMSV